MCLTDNIRQSAFSVKGARYWRDWVLALLDSYAWAEERLGGWGGKRGEESSRLKMYMFRFAG